MERFFAYEACWLASQRFVLNVLLLTPVQVLPLVSPTNAEWQSISFPWQPPGFQPRSAILEPPDGLILDLRERAYISVVTFEYDPETKDFQQVLQVCL